MCIDMCIEDMCTDVCIDMCADMWPDMCADICVDMGTGMCVVEVYGCRSVHRHVCRNGPDARRSQSVSSHQAAPVSRNQKPHPTVTVVTPYAYRHTHGCTDAQTHAHTHACTHRLASKACSLLRIELVGAIEQI